MSNLRQSRSRPTSSWMTVIILTVFVGGFGLFANNIIASNEIQTANQKEATPQTRGIVGMGIIELGHLNVVSTFLYN